MPAVSVIIPVHNRASLLERAVDSAAGQSFDDLEILIGDDASTDGTLDTARRLARRDPRIRIFTWPLNMGVSSARNRLLRAARGENIALLDSDDSWHPDKLRRQMAIMNEDPETGVVHTLERWFRNEKEIPVPGRLLRTDEDPFLANLRRCTVSPSSALIRRSLLDRYGDFDPGMTACEDQDLWLRLARRTRFHCIKEKLTIRYGGRKDQLSACIPALDRFRIVCLLKQLLDESLPEAYRKPVLDTLEEKAYILAAGYAKRDRPFEAGLYDALARRVAGIRLRTRY